MLNGHKGPSYTMLYAMCQVILVLNQQLVELLSSNCHNYFSIVSVANTNYNYPLHATFNLLLHLILQPLY